MDSDEPKQLIATLRRIQTTDTLTLCAATKLTELEKEPPRRLDIRSEAAADALAIYQRFATSVKKKIESGEVVVRDYDGGAAPTPHEIEYLKLSDEPDLAQMIKAFSTVATIKRYSSKKDASSDFGCLVFATGLSKNAVLGFRKQTRPAELATEKKLRIFPADGVFDALREVSFIIDDRIDALQCGDILYVVNKDNFHQICGFYEALEKFAKDAMKSIKALVPIDNFEEFESIGTSDKTLMKTLRTKIKTMPKTFDMDKIVESVKRDKIPVTLVKKNGRYYLKFDKANRHAFMVLLADGFTVSPITGRRYENANARLRNV